MTIQTISSNAVPLDTRCRCMESRLENAASRVALAAIGAVSASFSLVSFGLTFVNNPIWLLPTVLFGGVAMTCFAEAFSRPSCPIHDHHIHVVEEHSSAPNIIYYDRRPWYTSIWPRWRPNRVPVRPDPIRVPVGHRGHPTPQPARAPVGRRETPRTSWTPAPTRAPVGRREVPMPAARPTAPKPEPVRAPVGRREESRAHPTPRATWTPQPSAPPRVAHHQPAPSFPRPSAPPMEPPAPRMAPAGGGMRAPVNVRR